MTTTPEISPEAMAGYRAGARQRQQAARRALAAREARAWMLARQAAGELRRQFGVSRVVVFGSLIHPGCFTAWSDVDLAAWGLDADTWLRAIGVAMDGAVDIPVNLVDAGACSASLLRVIEQEGVDL